MNEDDQAIYVATEVCSVYTDRNEALVNAGAIALSRETSAYVGYGRSLEQPEWGVVRLSQEHGILGTQGSQAVDDVFQVGQRVNLFCNHACITAAAFYLYFVVDDDNIVREAWVPWKGW